MKQHCYIVFLIILATACAPQAEGIFGTTVAPDSGAGFTGTVYFLEAGTGVLPDFSSLTPVGTLYTTTLDISPRSFEEGFPGITNRFEWFALRYKAVIDVVTAGDYGFRLLSDDGSRLTIDGALIIDNDGIHGVAAVTGQVTLTPGTHQITVDYFQGPRNEIALQLFVTPPGKEEVVFSTVSPY